MSDETPQKPDVKGEKDKGKISINVVFPHEEAIQFRVKTTTPFQKIYDSIAANKGVANNSFSLAHDGERILGHQTPKMLEMEDGDQIDGQLEQVGGGQRDARP